jgi:hypothetical protein
MILDSLISCAYEVVIAFLRCDGRQWVCDSLGYGVFGARLGFSQVVFDFGEELFDLTQSTRTRHAQARHHMIPPTPEFPLRDPG